ncbi:methyltransferase domain-containing protein [Falsihalocynthiibacter sp. SS001]|uniref:class I SAM-dependent methyltransferase n=1 Tax=Falsihalocynthiibacter sp. SS001 TaxID=3349698 RepID=UPI0036D40B3D
MHLDVRDLKSFYYRSALGRAAQKAIRDQVVEFWPEAKGQTVVGYGFAVPLLRPYLATSRRIVGLMPGPQGVMPWPPARKNVSVLCEEMNWPLDTGVVDKLVVMHGLETSEHPSALLEECFRVLGPGGKALFIVPNRAGLWSRSDQTPFGFGRPYSLAQLESQLKLHNLVPERHRATLFALPSNKRFWLRAAPVLEKSGRKVSNYIAGGVLMIEATKQLQAPTRPGIPEAIKRPFDVLGGIKRPIGGRVGEAS